ncbi:hypothetical protein [Alienimonas chondri]|uniref:Uncharacterized protein n=1 Tax=Alienimonas chondri TaxID=2681879 RepID=A0ABX1VF89_9PLAN|nr:hypothetical protein [Alienimonas chondri]NNJ26757.1 hypothetical protein [Alienimonas chondri]
MTPTFDESAGLLRLQSYTDAWRLGTGLPSSLPPGEYAVTGRRLTPYGLIVEVVGSYRVRLPLPMRKPIDDSPTSFASAAHAMA